MLAYSRIGRIQVLQIFNKVVWLTYFLKCDSILIFEAVVPIIFFECSLKVSWLLRFSPKYLYVATNSRFCC